MKIGVFTLYDLGNYGNRLQNYAVVKKLNSFTGVEAETVVVYPIIKRYIKKILKKIKVAKPDSKEYVKKTEMFAAFTQENIPTHIYFRLLDRLTRRFDKKYDFYVAGSDQIWNPTYGTGLKEYYLLDFAKKEKKIFLSASFGLECIPEKLKRIFKKNLMGCKSISVREANAVRMLKEIGVNNVHCFLDPVFLLNRNEWMEIEKEVKTVRKNKYLLTYFLSKQGNERVSEIDAFAKEYNLDIINLNNKSDLSNYILDPAEFLFLFRNAAFIVTDSFHGTAFSIIFNIPFITYGREDKISETNSRMVSILSMLHLNHRMNVKLTNDVMECDFFIANEIIQKEVAAMEEYLQSSINNRQE